MTDELYFYEGIVVRVVDGDTVDVDIDLGFGIVLKKKAAALSGHRHPRKTDPQSGREGTGFEGHSPCPRVVWRQDTFY